MNKFTIIVIIFSFLNGYGFQRLNLSEKSLTSTYQISTANSHLISHLDLSYNDIEILETGNLNLFTSLSNLNLIWNRIRCIKNGTFIQLSRLRFLRLSNNYLTKLQNLIFNGLILLNHLSLVNNQIEIIEENAFLGLDSLDTLLMSRNKLKSLDGINLSHMKILKTLGLSFNRFNTMNMSVFDRLESLEILYLDFNRIKFIMGQARMNHLKIIYLGNLNLEIIQKNVFIEMKTPIEMRLRSQRIRIIETDAFGGSITRLALDGNLINRIDDDSFGYLPLLVDLILSNNNIDTFSNRYFKFELPNLKTLSLDSNYVNELNTDFGKMFRNLTLLELSNNQIKTINKKSFKILNKLEIIYLQNNTIGDIEKGSFLNQIDLKELYLDNNFLSNLGEGLFETQLKLMVLSLKNNKIYQILNNSFYGLVNLKYLYLNKNYLKSFMFNHINRLEGLYLSENLIEIIDVNNFGNYEHLRVIDLSNNKIKIIPGDLFLAARTLEYLNISHNHLIDFNLCNYSSTYLKALQMNNIKSKIKINKNLCLNNFVNLEILDLSNNLIEFDSTKLLETNKRMKEIYLSNINLTDLEMIDCTNLSLIKVDLSHNIMMKFNSMNLFECEILNDDLDEIKLKKTGLARIFIDMLNEFELDEKKWSAYHFIDFSDNNIEWLPEIFFKAEYLDLSKNNIKNINGNHRIKMPYVVIHLNFMQSITFEMNYQLECFTAECKFSHNNLKYFPLLRFIVNFLDLGYNKIEKIKSSYLTDCVTLDYLINMETLLINNNQVAHIEPCSFENIPNLRYLSLEYNHLNESIDPGLFNNLSKLEYLLLGNNNISYLRSYQFHDLDRLKFLDLSFNNLYFIQEYSFYSLSYLKSLCLEENKKMILSNKWIYESERIKNFYISEEILSNISNIQILKETIRPQRIEERMDTVYYNTIYLIANDSKMKEYSCYLTLFFIKNNIPFNLKDDLDFINFLRNCLTLSLKA